MTEQINDTSPNLLQGLESGLLISGFEHVVEYKGGTYIGYFATTDERLPENQANAEPR